MSKGSIMRMVAIVVVISICHVPMAFAGETLREAAVRAADRLVAAEATSPQATRPNAATTATTVAKAATSRRPANALQQIPRGLQESTGIGTGLKVLLGVGIAAVLGGIMMSIDSRVEDNTPSTRGERTNEPF